MSIFSLFIPRSLICLFEVYLFEININMENEKKNSEQVEVRIN